MTVLLWNTSEPECDAMTKMCNQVENRAIISKLIAQTECLLSLCWCFMLLHIFAAEEFTSNGSHRSSTMSTSSVSSNSTSESKRQARINELIATEEDYVRDLEIVAVIFRDQLFSTKAITPSDRDIIFSNWDQLIEGNQKFVKMLHKKKRESLQSGMSIERIGSTITFALEMMEKAYIYYCNRLLTAEKLIEKKSDDSGYFADQVKRFSRDPPLQWPQSGCLSADSIPKSSPIPAPHQKDRGAHVRRSPGLRGREKCSECVRNTLLTCE